MASSFDWFVFSIIGIGFYYLPEIAMVTGGKKKGLACRGEARAEVGEGYFLTFLTLDSAFASR